MATIRVAAKRYSDWSGDRVIISGFGTAGRCEIVPIGRGLRSEHDDATGNIKLNFDPRDFSEPWRQAVVMHEVGHSFGLEHLPPGEHGVMSGEVPDLTLDFTRSDLDECHRTGNCQDRP